MSNETIPTNSRRVGRPARGSEGDATLRILDAATLIFLSQGFEAASIDAIATAAGVSKKTFYVRFNSKADLFEAVCVRFIELHIPAIERESLEPGPVRERLYRIALATLNAALAPDLTAFQRIITAEAMRFPQFALAMADFGQARIHAFIERCLEDGVRNGEIAVDDIRFAADTFFNLFLRAPFNKAVLGLERPEMTFVKRMALLHTVDLFMRSCRL